LETKLAANPNDLSIRNQLIGYYVQGQFTSKSSRQAHQNHILWLIEHHPEAPVLASPLYGDLNSVLDGSAYEKAKDLWMKQVANHPKDAVFAGKAARFCLMEDSETAEKLLKQAKVLDPKNPKWREDLAELYQLKAMDSKPGVGNSAARKALMELEKARDLTRDESEKSQFLPDLAKMAFASGDLVKARKYASDLLQKKDGNEGLRDDDSGIHFGNLILGRIALSEGKIAEAKKHLLDAARITSSQTLQITGPNMALAAELLEKGEKQTVLEYLQLCGKFWRTGAGKLARWKKEIEAGVSPQFDASQLN
jgi:tetratricopeptide (TPR) repeat protein